MDSIRKSLHQTYSVPAIKEVEVAGKQISANEKKGGNEKSEETESWGTLLTGNSEVVSAVVTLN